MDLKVNENGNVIMNDISKPIYIFSEDKANSVIIKPREDSIDIGIPNENNEIIWFLLTKDKQIIPHPFLKSK